ncbi:MAG TPA: hypothetical protein VGF80_05505 [Galbitalea sp.]|jgi:hypothetical protein
MAGALDREDLIEGLRELIKRAHAAGLADVSIRIVGGAAIRLAHFERATTADIDAQIKPLDQIVPIAKEIALERGWPADWLNDKATMFIPHLGATVEWESIFEDDVISISVAPIDALLAMKLRAGRPGRDTEDIRSLLSLNFIKSIDEAESLFEGFYPGDALSDRTIELLQRLFELGLPQAPERQPPIALD